MPVYQTYVNMMNARIRDQFSISNPFCFRHISNLSSLDEFDDLGPSVVMASPGLLSFYLFSKFHSFLSSIFLVWYCLVIFILYNLVFNIFPPNILFTFMIHFYSFISIIIHAYSFVVVVVVF